jgi:hypothetical protein
MITTWPRLNLTPAERQSELDFYTRNGFPRGHDSMGRHKTGRTIEQRFTKLEARAYWWLGHIVNPLIILIPLGDAIVRWADGKTFDSTTVTGAMAVLTVLNWAAHGWASSGLKPTS